MRLKSVLFVSSVVCVCGSSALAGPIVYTVTGTISNVYGSAPSLPGGQAGDTLQFVYTVNGNANPHTTTSTLAAWEGVLGDTLVVSASATLTASGGGSSQTVSLGTLIYEGGLVRSNFVSGSNLIDSFDIIADDGSLRASTILKDYGTTGSPPVSSITDLNLPTVLDISTFSEGGVMELGNWALQNDFYRATVTSVVVDNPVIPLPSGAAMAIVGLGAVSMRRRR